MAAGMENSQVLLAESPSLLQTRHENGPWFWRVQLLCGRVRAGTPVKCFGACLRRRSALCPATFCAQLCPSGSRAGFVRYAQTETSRP